MRISINEIKDMKQKGEKIAMLTTYDYAAASIIDEVGVPLTGKVGRGFASLYPGG